MNPYKKIIVFDDDPTGSQTVFDCPLLLKWNEKILIRGLQQPSSLMFLLANTRALPPSQVEEKIKLISRHLKNALMQVKLSMDDILFISRGDSTLRGHGFLEGGRTTENGWHLLNGTPVHETEFANDKIFGYSTSFLPSWIEEKSQSKIKSNDVEIISYRKLDFAISSKEGFEGLFNFLKKLSSNQTVVVDAKSINHLLIFSKAIWSLKNKKRFLFRSAASLINGLANLPSNSNSMKCFSSLRIIDDTAKPKPGLIVIGSHVKLANDQLKFLLSHKSFKGIQVPVEKIARIFKEKSSSLLLSKIENILHKEIYNCFKQNKTPVLYTSRKEYKFNSNDESMQFGLDLAGFMAECIVKINSSLGYIISKGGITTNILLAKGFKLEMLHLKGQIIPGVSVVCPYMHTENLIIPIITFPGNFGDENAIFDAWKFMEP